MVILAEMAKQKGCQQTASGLSAKTGLPEPTVAKVLKLLARGELIASSRGVNGGYTLGKDPIEINMADVITALEGPVQLTSCVGGNEECCSHAVHCSVKGKWDPVNVAMQQALQNVSLEQMIGSRA